MKERTKWMKEVTPVMINVHRYVQGDQIMGYNMCSPAELVPFIAHVSMTGLNNS